MKTKLHYLILLILIIGCTNKIIKLNKFQTSPSIILESENYKIFFPINKILDLIKYELNEAKIDSKTYEMYVSILESSNLLVPLALKNKGQLLEPKANEKLALLINDFDRKLIQSNSFLVYDKIEKIYLTKIKISFKDNTLTIKSFNGNTIYSNFYSFK